MNGKCRILICDDQEEFRGLVKVILKREPDIEVVGEAADGREAVEQARKLRPDVVLMDLKMPVLSGMEATRRIRIASKRTKVLVVSGFSGEESVTPCLEAGASGHLPKYRCLAELKQAIATVRKGELYLSPRAPARVSRAQGTQS